jgi:hypothetical protein
MGNIYRELLGSCLKDQIADLYDPSGCMVIPEHCTLRAQEFVDTLLAWLGDGLFECVSVSVYPSIGGGVSFRFLDSWRSVSFNLGSVLLSKPFKRVDELSYDSSVPLTYEVLDKIAKFLCEEVGL